MEPLACFEYEARCITPVGEAVDWTSTIPAVIERSTGHAVLTALTTNFDPIDSTRRPKKRRREK